MNKFWILIFVSFFATNSLEKAESVKLELKTFDEIFGEGWWDKGEAEDLKMPAPTNFGQNVHHQIDRQNTQIGQIEPNSTNQNLPLTESDHSDNAKNGEEQNEVSSNENIAEDERKRKIIAKFHAMKEVLKQKGKYSAKEWNQIEEKIAKHLKVTRSKVYKWKRELGQSTPNLKYSDSEQKELMKRYYETKNKNRKIRDEDIAKMLKIGSATLFRWKKQFERQKFDQNSVDGHSVEVNAGSNVQKIGRCD